VSWWETDNNDDVIGDQPSDLVRNALREISRMRGHRSGSNPTLNELLVAIGTVAEQNPRFCESKSTVPIRLNAKLKTGEMIRSDQVNGTSVAADLVQSLTTALRELSKIYQERWGRKPRLSEWASAFAFVLRYKPEEFVADGAEHPLSDIEVEYS
jgi:Arc/MetJ-type ribon-helix-helix transcriptional regulator